MAAAKRSDREVLERRLARANQRVEILERLAETTSRDLYRANQNNLRERKYAESLLESMACSLVVTSATGTIQRVNSETLSLLGYEAEELIGQPFDTILDEEEGDAEEFIAAPCAGRASGRQERTYIAKGGRRISVLVSGTPIQTDAEQIEAAFFVAMDITDHKRTEGRFKAMVETSADAIMTLAPPTWAFTSGNPATVAMFRARDEHHFASKAPWQLSPPRQPDGEASASKAKRMIETAIRDGSHFFEWTHLRLDGDAFPATVLLTKFKIAGDMQLQATVRDITERKRAAQEYLRLSKAVEQVNESIVITDLDGIIQYVNPAFERVTGYSRREVLGQATRLLNSGIQPADFYAALWNTIQSGQVWSGRFSNKKKDGSIFVEDATISPVFDEDGTITNYVAVKKDVTEQIALEARASQGQKLEAIGQLAAGVAHDFNNLLQGIAAHSEVALDEAPSASSGAAVQSILDLTARGGRLTRQILDFSRRSASERTPSDLCAMVQDNIDFLRRIVRRDVVIVLKLNAPSAVVLADTAQLEEALTNLVINARDAMPQGGKVRVTLDVIDRDVLLRVEDDGTGLAEADLEHIFDPFFTTKSPGQGTGLGLSQVYGIVQQHNGHIAARNRVGGGAVFEIRLPLHGGDAAGRVQLPSSSYRVGNGELILLVEDEAIVRRGIRRSLSTLGYNVIEAENGEDALDRLSAAPNTKLVVTDLVMPRMGGTELIRKLQQVRPELPIIVMSGYSQDQALSEHERAFSKWLVKPFERKLLGKAVFDALGHESDAPAPPSS